MALPTNTEIDAAVPAEGTPSRLLTNAVLKNIVGAADAWPSAGSLVVRTPDEPPFTPGRIKAAAATDPEDCVPYQQVQAMIPTFATLADVPASLKSAKAAGTASIRAIGTTATTAAAGNHTHSAATASAAGFMTAAQFSKIDAMPAFRLVASPPATPTDPGEMWDIALTSDALFICVAANEWRQVTLTAWGV